MANKLLIIMVNSDPDTPSELAAPFLQAAVAAAMEYEVEIIFSGQAGQLAIQGVADNIRSPQDESKTIYDLIKDACEAGAKCKASTEAVARWGNDLIPEIEETVGEAYLISEAMDDETVTFTY